MTNPDHTPVPPRDQSILQQFGMFGLVLGQFLGASGVGVALGWALWKKAGFPWWTILITSLLGIYAASVTVIRYQRKLNRLADRSRERP